jgi:cytochrome c-type biogenesis protein CcmF
MNELGIFCLLASISVLVFSIFQTSIGIIWKKEICLELGKNSLLANFLIILLTFLILMTGLARMDLTNHYVVMHSSEHLPLFYRITSIWSGSSGSLLFWNLLLNLFTFVAIFFNQNKNNERLPFMHLTLATLSLFFSFLAVFYEDAQPFRQFSPAAVVGRGLNPLLQHWAMIIHPPILYIG